MLTKFETLSNIRVGSGSFALNDLKKTTNFGITKVAKTIDDDDCHDRHDRWIDHGGGDL